MSLWFNSVCSADQITLRPALRLTSLPAELRLADVATLEGPAALALADTIVARVETVAAARELSLSDIRAVLDKTGIHWGQVDLVGRGVILRPPASSSSAQDAPKPSPRESIQSRTIIATELVESNTVGGAALRVILAAARLQPDALQVVLEPRDLPLWDSIATGGVQFEIQPLSSLNSDRTELAVRTWRDGRVESRQSLTIRTLHRVDAVTLVRDVARNHTIDEDDLQSAMAWLPPSQAADAAQRGEIVGRAATASLKAGQVVQTRHIRDENVIKRGERALVRCAVGSVVISLQADALADGARGQSIEFRKIGQRTTFMAVVTGPGEAVVDLPR